MKYFLVSVLSNLLLLCVIEWYASLGMVPPGTERFVLKYPDKVAEIVYQHIADTAKVDMGVSCTLEKK